jgi:hypothetical protein
LSSYKVAHCYAQTPWILRWVDISSPPPYRPWLTLSPLFGQLFDTPDLVPTPGGHPEPLLLTPYLSQMDTPTRAAQHMPEYIDMCSACVPWCKDGQWSLYVADCNFGFVSVINVYHDDSGIDRRSSASRKGGRSSSSSSSSWRSS